MKNDMITFDRKKRCMDYDRAVILNEWNEAKAFLKTLTKEKFKEMFGKDRNCHKVVRVCLDHARRFGFITNQKRNNALVKLCFETGVITRYSYDISTYKIEDIEQPNAVKAIQKMSKLGLMKMVQDTNHDEFGNVDTDNIKAMKRLQSKGHSGDDYVKPNRYYLNRFIMFVLDEIMYHNELGSKNNWHQIDLDNISNYDIQSFDGSYQSMNKLFNYIRFYLFDIRIIILDNTNYYNNYIKQIMSTRGYNISNYLKGKLNKEDTLETWNLIMKELRHHRLEQSLSKCIETCKSHGTIINDWIQPLLDNLCTLTNELNNLMPLANFRFEVHQSDKKWCGEYLSTRLVCNITTSRDKKNNPNDCDKDIFKYTDGTSFFKRPKETDREVRDVILDKLGLVETEDSEYDVKSCLPNLIMCYKNNGIWFEGDRHSEVCEKYGLRNRNVAKVGAFRGIFNSWKSDGKFVSGIEQALGKDRKIDKTNVYYQKEIEWMKENGYINEKGNYISRTIKDATIPEGYIFCQYCADTFNSALACREMYKNDMYPSDLFIIESVVEAKTMLHFARKGHKVANAYDHIYTDGKIDSKEFHRVYGEYASETVKEYIKLRKINKNRR